MSELHFAYKPDAEQAMQRMAAWWERAIIDRPAILLTAPKPNPRPCPQKHHASLRERWMDIDYQVECADTSAANTYWAGDGLPMYMPNLGPELLTACYGAELEFTDDSSWSVPILHDWADIPKLRVDPQNVYLHCILEMTRRACEVGRGKFVVGITDIHPGADLAASFRDPQQFAIDLVQDPEHVRELMNRIYTAFFDFYEINDQVIRQSGQTITTSWLPFYVDNQRYYIPSSDFSIMVSTAMYKEFFLPELLAEIEWLDRSIYHLDGPGALRHLDTLLEIDKLDAIQYVFGDGAKPASRWMDVYQRIQASGKGMYIAAEPWEIPLFMDRLDPEGTMFHIAANSVEEADSIIQMISRWTHKGKY